MARAASIARRPDPPGHFSTASQGMPQIGEQLARALLALMDQEGLDTFVDMGCGRGELLEQVHRLGPHIDCIGVDIVARPELSEPIGWFQSPGGSRLPDELDGLTDTLVFANEWLDVVPCPIAEMDEHGELREILVEASSGDERLGDPVSGTDRLWCQWFWPIDRLEPGDRIEIGETRDTAWDDLVSRVASGLAVAVDYGHTIDSRPAPGTLTGFRQGRQVLPCPRRVVRPDRARRHGLPDPRRAPRSANGVAAAGSQRPDPPRMTWREATPRHTCRV